MQARVVVSLHFVMFLFRFFLISHLSPWPSVLIALLPCWLANFLSLSFVKCHMGFIQRDKEGRICSLYMN